MSDNILSKNGSRDLRVYVVWFNVLYADSRSQWDPGLISDPRVTQFWDDKRIAGDWFGRHIDGSPSFSWDAFYVYYGGAVWRDVPSPLAAKGSPVIRHVDDLARAITYGRKP